MTSTETITAGATDLYWEVRGSGRPVLLIAGTPGDAGQFDQLAEALAGDHLVITYDRRGTSRSAAADTSGPASVAQHADDAAAVLAAVGTAPALVYGTSNGAAVALELALRHPRHVFRAVLHEMPLLSVLADPDQVGDAMNAVIGEGMQRGGPTAALNAFLRFAFDDAIVDGWDPELRDRLLANAETMFSVELPAFGGYRPDPAALRSCEVQVIPVIGEEQDLPFFREAAEWLAAELGTEVGTVPGAHGGQFSCPADVAAAIRGWAAG